MQQQRLKSDAEKNSIMVKMANGWNKKLGRLWSLLHCKPIWRGQMKRSVQNCILADLLMVLSALLPISVFQNVVSLHWSQLLPATQSVKQCCRGIDMTREAVALLESMKIWTPGMAWDGPGQLASASFLLPKNCRSDSQMQQKGSGKLQPEKVQLFPTEKGPWSLSLQLPSQWDLC